ncbi:HAD-IIB family hydrolase [Halomonas halmophila]|uniref:Mannosyl-3-phosphoglycerate phosphatase n=1 Tax=Halomonas halmophila TaxID=252 RepID=A0A4Y4EZ63_9GAMM|nr:HAD-IIB family hydrolase [Halomonas halmophila]GED21645.1 mannosyl-3-phosphoglycerate phosphatase [Halomonas halmophila]
MSSTVTAPDAPRLLFSDLDGSLLDHYSYAWSPAADWLTRLASLGVPVIPVTSKTRSELLGLRRELGLEASPFVAENGAVVGLPMAWRHASHSADADGLVVHTLGIDIGFIRQRLAVWRERLGAHFTPISEMSLEHVIDLTGLPESQARLARMREGSEPLIWEDSDEKLEAFHQALEGDGLRCVRGGRFWHVTGEADKGDAVTWLITRFAAMRGVRPLTLALGDGPNDVRMLEAVDSAVVIPARHGLAVRPNQSALYVSRAMGPDGWAEGVTHWWGNEGVAPLEPAAPGGRSHE